jgi:hypothetical protein
MGSVPHHPFFLKVIDSLPRYDRSWVLPYITVMGSTGPLFLSIIWRHYNSGSTLAEKDRIRVLFPDEYSKHSWSFFTHHMGSSWHQKDVQIIMWVGSRPILNALSNMSRCIMTDKFVQMGQHWLFLTLIGFITGLSVIICLWWVYGRLLLSNGPKGQSLRRKIPFKFWRRSARHSQADPKREYELLDHALEDRHEV